MDDWWCRACARRWDMTAQARCDCGAHPDQSVYDLEGLHPHAPTPADAPSFVPAHGNCPATGRPHTTVLEREHLKCLDCQQVVESCCEGACSTRPSA